MDWNLPLFPPLINKLDISVLRPIFQELLSIGDILLSQRRPANESDIGIVCFGLTTLALRQAKAFNVLMEHRMEDQAVTIVRSLYETVINLAETMEINKSTPAGPSDKFNEMNKQCRLFIEHQRSVNKGFLQAVESQIKSLNGKIAVGQAGPNDPDAVASLQKFVSLHGSQINSDFALYKNAAGDNKISTYWNGKPPSKAATEVDLEFPQMYSWCCGFSHSSFYAIRIILHHDESTQEYGLADCSHISQGIAFFATFLLCNCLDACFGILSDFDNELQQVKALAAQLQSAAIAAQ